MNEPIFEFDSMLMYGWVADERRNVRVVNASLEDWLIRHSCERILRGVRSEAGVPLQKFFDDVLDLPNDVLEEIIFRLDRFPEIINLPSAVVDAPYRRANVEVASDMRPTGNGRLLLGVRSVAVGGFAMTSGRPEDLVDLITICRTQRVDGCWKVLGYQGQFQSAWLRIEPIVREGTKSGSVALMGRNLSHNIGSHALFWLEQESQTNAKASAQSVFYKYLRERMELLAGFATWISLSPRTEEFSSLIAEFSANTLLTSRLCKSEGVDSLEIEFINEASGCKVAIPGGTMGAQALYSLLENIIRDNAKYGTHVGKMIVPVLLDEVDKFPDYLRVRVRDSNSINPIEAKDAIELQLNELQIADQSGRLIEGYWGVKERFIAAALLRGIRVENTEFTDITNGQRRTNWNLNRKRHGEPLLLHVRALPTALEWEFYVLKAKDVLVVADETKLHANADDQVDVYPVEWLHKNIDVASSMRHQLVAIIPQGDLDLQWIEENRERLPFRTLVGGDLVTKATLTRPRIARFEFGFEVKPVELHRSWLSAIDPELNLRFILVKNILGRFRVWWRRSEPEKISEEQLRSFLSDENCLGLFDRHWTHFKNLPQRRLHYEACQGSDRLCAIIDKVDDGLDERVKCLLFEAALIRILIVDERIDTTTQNALVQEWDVRGCTVRRRFELKGVTIRGREYSGEAIPSRDHLMEWATEYGDNYYHFICIHRGILDKLKKGFNVLDVCQDLKRVTDNVIVHSGRAGSSDTFEGLKYVPLSNVVAWIESSCSKMEIVDELCLVRKI